MGCNCKKSGVSVSKPVRIAVTPKGRGVNNGRVGVKIQRGMRRQFK